MNSGKGYIAFFKARQVFVKVKSDQDSGLKIQFHVLSPRCRN